MASVDDLEIAAKISILGDLGQGSYGKVSVGSWNGAPVAVKMLHGVFFEVGLSETDSQMTSFLRKFQDEWQTMKVLRHPNILQLYGVADAQSKHAKIVSELMDESLASRLAKAPKLNHPMHLHILKSIICGLRYLHEHPSGPIVHRDLTSKNILLADNANRVKIADLGVAKAMSDIRAAMGTIMPGTELYMPPEVRSRVAIHTSLDIFSYGVIAIETLLAKSPSPGPLFVAVAENPGCFTVSKETVRRESELQSIPSDHPLKETVLACLNNDATARPTAAHIFLTVFQHLPLTTTVEQTVWQGDNARLESDITRLKNHITKLTRDSAKLTRENTKLRRKNTELNHDVAKLIGNKRLEARRLSESTSDLYLHERNLFSTSEVSKERPCSIALPATATSVASDRWYTLPRRRHRPRPQSFPHPISKNSETEVMPLYVAKYDYEASTENELSFQSGSLLYVLDDSNELWWWAKLEIEDKEGYIPVGYVEVYKTLLKYDWFYGKITRTDAEKMLMLPCNEDGSYLVRETESNDNGYSLSVRNGVTVSHYHIRQINALGFYIATSRRLFKDVADLVAHYQTDADGLCSNLRKPCVASMPPSKDDIRKSRGLSDQWEIAHDSLQWCHRIYEGDITDVFKCVLNKSTPVAVKILKENSLLSKEEFLEEIQIMKRVQHVNIIKVCGASTIEEPICIVYEHMKGGPLVSYLHGSNLDMSERIYMAIQISNGMAYLESIQYIHRDLAARNILVGQNNIVKIAGFSLLQIVSEEIYKSPVSNIMCAVKWSAPEVLFQRKFSVKSDVWSFGIVLVELVTHGGSPYPEMDQEEVKTRLAEGYRMPQMDGCPDRLYQIMLMCWKEEDMERPTFKIIKEQLEEIASSLFGIAEC